MRRIQFQSNQQWPPYFKLGTIRGMGTVATKMAVARKAVQEIQKIEKDMLRKGSENRQVFRDKMKWISYLAKSAGEAAGEAQDILRGIKKDVQGYLRNSRHVPD